MKIEDRRLWAEAIATFWEAQGKETETDQGLLEELAETQEEAFFTPDDVIKASYCLASKKAPDHLGNCAEMFHQLPWTMAVALAELMTAKAANKAYRTTETMQEDIVQIFCIAKHVISDVTNHCERGVSPQ